ncbi:MAG: recombinase family protein [Silvibacterium sp.]
MDQRLQFLSSYQKEEISVSELCREFGVSRPTGYRWINRYKESGPEGLLNLSSKPHRCSHATPEAIENAILALRGKYPSWGYKGDRLTRSLADFAKIIEHFDKYKVSFVSVTQHFNATTSMGRLTLNVLLSFAQFEREVTGERIRDKIAASKKKGMWMGGNVSLGYQVVDRKLLIQESEAVTVHRVFREFLRLGSVLRLEERLRANNIRTRRGNYFLRGPLYTMLRNPLYLGLIRHKTEIYPGEHAGIIDGPVGTRRNRYSIKTSMDSGARSAQHSRVSSPESSSMPARTGIRRRTQVRTAAAIATTPLGQPFTRLNAPIRRPESPPTLLKRLSLSGS